MRRIRYQVPGYEPGWLYRTFRIYPAHGSVESADGTPLRWSAYSMPGGDIETHAMTLKAVMEQIDEMLVDADPAKECRVCDELGRVEGIGGRQVECDCGLAQEIWIGLSIAARRALGAGVSLDAPC